MRNSDIAYEKIKMMIIMAELRPGQVLVESELMETTGLGRTPIREALNRLSWEGFVKIIPRQCIMVEEISINEVEYLCQMRLTLSGLESELAAKNRTMEELQRLEDTLEKLKNEDNLKKRILLDRQFHRIVSSMTKQPFLEKEMNKYQDLSIRMILLKRSATSNIDDMNVAQHEDIYRCIRDCDIEQLKLVQKEHVKEFKRKFIR